MTDSLSYKAWDACNAPYSEEKEDIAVQAVKDWLSNTDSSMKVEKYKSNTMLLVASEKGYPKVVQDLLGDKDLLKVEVNRQEELFQEAQKMDGDAAHDHPSGSGFAQAREKSKAKMKAAEAGELNDQGNDSRFLERARYKSCYDMITLYTYIGEEIPDALTLIGVISALRDLGWMSMEDIAEDWDKVRDELREKNKMEPLLLAKLSEARYNYDAWSHKYKHFDNEANAPIKSNSLKPPSLVERLVYATFGFLYAISSLLIVLIPGPVLVLLYDLVHYEEKLWLECYAWLGAFGFGQIIYALLAAPSTGWGMIKEASRDTDFGAKLKGSMNMQGLVSTFLFSTIMGRLQVGLDFDLTNNATQVSTLEFQINSSHFRERREIAAMVGSDATEHVLEHWCAMYAFDL